MSTTEIETTKNSVLEYLKKSKLQNRESYDRLILFAVKPHDIVKYIERPEECGRWPLDFVKKVDDAVIKISKKFLIDMPEIEVQTEEDKVLSKLLRKNNHLAFGTDSFFRDEITVHHVIAFMERNEAIYEWNGDFVLRTQREVQRVKEFLL